jgi:D-aminopeptidase
MKRTRVRDLGIEPGTLVPGDHNALVDVPGVSVGHVTLDEGGPKDPPCLRTGVTAIHPDSRDVFAEPVTGAVHVLNGYGKSVGLPQVRELGAIETPLTLTNTLNVWRVADATVTRVLDRHPEATSVNAVTGECNDGLLNDIRGRHVTAEHVREAVEGADAAETAEGCVGAGRGTTGFGWKAGIGTASRRADGHTVGVLVLTNTGKPADLRVDGLPVGRHVRPDDVAEPPGGSIMIVVGTDAAVSARQLDRVAKRAPMGLARAGGIAHHGSGDFVVAFANDGGGAVADEALTPLFRAAIEATEEAIYNSLTQAETTTGVDGQVVPALPLDPLRELSATHEKA